MQTGSFLIVGKKGSSLAVQGLRPCVFNAGVAGSIPGRGANIPQDLQPKKKEAQRALLSQEHSGEPGVRGLPRPGNSDLTHFPGEAGPPLHTPILCPIVPGAPPWALQEPLPLCVGPSLCTSETRPGRLAKAVTSLRLPAQTCQPRPSPPAACAASHAPG